MMFKPTDSSSQYVCDVARCKAQPDVIFRAGATLLNPRRDVRVCDKHQAALFQEEDKIRDERRVQWPGTSI